MEPRYVPPPSVAHAAAWALDLRAMLPPSRRCCTPAGLRTARRLAAREPFTRAQLTKLWSYHQRHRVDEGKPGWGVDSKGWQASLAWGGEAGEKWAARVLGR
jgi:hypothetical protein